MSAMLSRLGGRGHQDGEAQGFFGGRQNDFIPPPMAISILARGSSNQRGRVAAHKLAESVPRDGAKQEKTPPLSWGLAARFFSFLFFLHLCKFLHISGAMDFSQAKVRADIFKALAHPVRVLVVQALAERDMCVCELNRLAKIDQSGVSRHLAALKSAGIISERREGAKIMHHLETPCILNAFDCAAKVLESEIQRRRKALKGRG